MKRFFFLTDFFSRFIPQHNLLKADVLAKKLARFYLLDSDYCRCGSTATYFAGSAGTAC
jgi:hypothetical protein